MRHEAQGQLEPGAVLDLVERDPLEAELGGQRGDDLLLGRHLEIDEGLADAPTPSPLVAEGRLQLGVVDDSGLEEHLPESLAGRIDHGWTVSFPGFRVEVGTLR